MISSDVEYNTLLSRHPRTPRDFVSGIEVRVRQEGPFLTCVYVLTGSLARMRVPSPVWPCRVDGLWKHTCFEAFVRVKGESAYYELNFSPSGEWAVYSFRDYRDGGPIEDDELDPKIAVRRKTQTFELTAIIHLDKLPTIQSGGRLRLGLSAVIEGIDGRLSYWALEHPPGKPDFHHPDNFALEIPLAGSDS